MTAARGVRLVAVLGYSGSERNGLHEICSARLRRAEQESRNEDVLLLSGWARRRRTLSEAELMAGDWRGRSSSVLLDRTARSTLANAVGVARVAHTLGAPEVVLVTSSWHGRRARSLLQAALGDTPVTVTLAATDETGSARARLREVACWTVVPLQNLLAGARGRRERALLGSAR